MRLLLSMVMFLMMVRGEFRVKDIVFDTLVFSRLVCRSRIPSFVISNCMLSVLVMELLGERLVEIVFWVKFMLLMISNWLKLRFVESERLSGLIFKFIVFEYMFGIVRVMLLMEVDTL